MARFLLKVEALVNQAKQGSMSSSMVRLRDERTRAHVVVGGLGLTGDGFDEDGFDVEALTLLEGERDKVSRRLTWEEKEGYLRSLVAVVVVW